MSGRNPSSRRHRLPIAGLALVGFLIAGYLALIQLEVLERVWDPIFGFESSRAVLESSFSRALPVPDAAPGAASYALELVLELAGPEDRFASRPWLPLAFGALVLFAAAVSVFLIVMQAAVIESWCALCLASAGIALAIVPLAMPEVLAALRQVRRAQRAGVRLLDAVVGR
jgi:uncharacterized membrane protein